MSEYDVDVDGDGYADQAVTVEYGDTTATLVDLDGDGYPDVVVYEPTEAADPGYQEDPGTEYDPGTAPAEVDPVSSSYYNEYIGTGVSSYGEEGYISLGNGEFYSFGE